MGEQPNRDTTGHPATDLQSVIFDQGSGPRHRHVQHPLIGRKISWWTRVFRLKGTGRDDLPDPIAAQAPGLVPGLVELTKGLVIDQDVVRRPVLQEVHHFTGDPFPASHKLDP